MQTEITQANHCWVIDFFCYIDRKQTKIDFKMFFMGCLPALFYNEKNMYGVGSMFYAILFLYICRNIYIAHLHALFKSF